MDRMIHYSNNNNDDDDADDAADGGENMSFYQWKWLVNVST